MSSPFVRASTAIAAGAVMLAALVATPVAAIAAGPAGIPGIPDDAVTVTPDPDGAGQLYTLTDNVTTFTTITMPNDATLDGAGHTITAVEDATHRNFPGPVLASAVGDDTDPAQLDVKNLDVTTQGFEGGSNSGGLLTGIYLYRAGGSLTNVSVDGISHGNGVQEGNAISIRNRVSGDDINVPRARVALADVVVTNYQKTGLLLDGNLTFAVENVRVGQGAGPLGQANPAIAANSLQVSRGASGSVMDSTFKLNSHVEATAVLLYNARTVDFDRVMIDGAAPATTGINVSNVSNTIDTTFKMRGGAVTSTAAAAGSVGVVASGKPGGVTATLIDTPVAGWARVTHGDVTVTTTPSTPSTPTTPTVPSTPTVPNTPTVTKVDVTGSFTTSRPADRRLRVALRAFQLAANQAEGSLLRWTIRVDGHRAAAISQHAGDTELWKQTFRTGTGTHTVEILKNGVSQHTYKVRTR